MTDSKTQAYVEEHRDELKATFRKMTEADVMHLGKEGVAILKEAKRLEVPLKKLGRRLFKVVKDLQRDGYDAWMRKGDDAPGCRGFILNLYKLPLEKGREIEMIKVNDGIRDVWIRTNGERESIERRLSEGGFGQSEETVH